MDYICGEFAAVFDKCELQWKTYAGDTGSNNGKIGYIVAPKTSPYVFRDCTVTLDDENAPGVAGLYGRTWGANSNAVFINTETNGYIKADGWGEMVRKQAQYLRSITILQKAKHLSQQVLLLTTRHQRQLRIILIQGMYQLLLQY